MLSGYNQAFKKDYDKIFKEDPAAANIFLLLVELANDKGEVRFNGTEDQANDEVLALVNARFSDIEAYQL